MPGRVNLRAEAFGGTVGNRMSAVFPNGRFPTTLQVGVERFQHDPHSATTDHASDLKVMQFADVCRVIGFF